MSGTLSVVIKKEKAGADKLESELGKMSFAFLGINQILLIISVAIIL